MCLFVRKQKVSFINLMRKWPGGALEWQEGGIRLIHGLTKSTLITYFFRCENRPQIRVFPCIFLNLPVMSFPKCVYMTKNTPFFPILHVFAPLNDVHAYIAWSWKTTLIMWIFGRAWYPLDIQVPPPGKVTIPNVKDILNVDLASCSEHAVHLCHVHYCQLTNANSWKCCLCSKSSNSKNPSSNFRKVQDLTDTAGKYAFCI